MDENKQVRVDNWGVFFLQRLQLFFNKTDYCDLTLQFQGNVQLKVHRLVLNACTEYFELLENSDRLIDDHVILMPETLQPDVVVPIINFMYTGMLEYPLSVYNRLCQAAELMHISVLTKLLDAQKQSLILNKSEKITKPKVKEIKSEPNLPTFTPVKKVSPKPSSFELPSPTPSPGRKLSGWKRKSIAASSNSSFLGRSDSMRHSDPLALDEAKPTRFEWPEDDLELPNMDMMDISGFGDISYNSKPLLREDEVKPIISKSDALKNSVKEEIHEMKLEDKLNHEISRNGTEKRKADSILDRSPKKIRIVESEKDTTISVIANDNSPNFDPTKIVSEILKKYPHLVKKKKNIKLKIVTKQPEKETPKLCSPSEKTAERIQTKTPLRKAPVCKPEPVKPLLKDNIWTCKECEGEAAEFMLYYLYRKHMTDVHNVKFDPRICKYCGIAFSRNEQQAYHLFTKHGRKPPGNQVYPSCSLCPYVAPSNKTLQVHKNKHKKTEMQCTCCKLAFISPEAISNHMQITGHMGKIKKINLFDCQYCTKSSQSAVSLLCHIKSNHETEGKRDGIVSLDEIDMEESDVQFDDPVEEQEPYVVPEAQKNKVKIISDVTVPASKNKTTTENVTLDQSKSHVSVPTSIATSLGLLDIVVLDENQQFILHNQAEQTENSQTEYILPQLDTRNVAADGLPSNDELVMVLTDQDYKDGHSGITADNSNIVVLYSHPADGQQGQFITSQGNLMVNSETGMLEIRNGAAIATTSANQIVMRAPAENHIETIEMIQREIDEGQDLKQESFYDDQKPKIVETQEPVQYIENQQIEIQNQPIEIQSQPIEIRNQPIEIQNHPIEIQNQPIEIQDQSMEIEDQSMEIQDQSMEIQDQPIEIQNQTTTETEVQATPDVSVEEIKKPEIEDETDDQVPANDTILKEKVEEQTPTVSTVEEIEPVNNTLEADKSVEEQNSDESVVDSKVMEPVPMEIEESSIVEESAISSKEEVPSLENAVDHPTNIEDPQEKQPSETEEDIPVASDEKETAKTEDSEQNSAAMEVKDDVPTESDTSKEIEIPEEQSQISSEKDEEKPYSPTDNPIDMDCDAESETNKKHDSVSLHENSIEISQCEKDTENLESTVSSQSSQIVEEDDTPDKLSDDTKESTTMSILDDWEDTDSQQSDNKTKLIKKGAQETVHKLMDDWDEEEVEK